MQRHGEAGVRPRDYGPSRIQWVRELHHDALPLQGRGVFLARDLDLDLRDRRCFPDPEHLRVDICAGDDESLARPAWLVPDLGRGRRSSGQTSSSKYALTWQWSGGGGVGNGIGDFDQIDSARLS